MQIQVAEEKSRVERILAGESKANVLSQDEIAELRALLPVGSEIKTILRHVARSGMMRVVLPTFQGERIPYIEEVTQFRYNRNHDGYTVHGCGTDVGFELVYNLSSAIWPEYDCIGYDDKPHGQRCPSADHVNSGECRKNTHHKDGYALRQRWI